MSGRPAPRGRDSYRHWTRITMRTSDDNSAGHVDNSVYYSWFDTALVCWFTAAGLLDRAKGGPAVFIAENGCRYLAELASPGEVEIGVAIERIGTSSMTFRVAAFRAGGEAPAAEGTVAYVCVDPASRRPVPLPANWRAALETIA